MKFQHKPPHLQLIRHFTPIMQKPNKGCKQQRLQPLLIIQPQLGITQVMAN